MIHVEIETGTTRRGWGYEVHGYVGEHGERYVGTLAADDRFDSERDARRDAEQWLDDEYGKGGWEHI